MELLDFRYSGNVGHWTHYQEEHRLRDWATRQLDAREQVDDDAGLHSADDRNNRCLAPRSGARQMGAEFWRRFSNPDLYHSDSPAVHYCRPRLAGELSSVLDQPSRIQRLQHQRVQQACGRRTLWF